MELKEDNISFADIKRYLSLLVKDIDGMNNLEFKTLKGWFVYSLSLVILFSVPSVAVLLVTGLMSGGMEPALLLSVSFIPVIFITPLTLLLTYFNNYRKPKRLRKRMLDTLLRYQWDGPIRQTGQARFESEKNNFTFRTEIYPDKDKNSRKQLFVCMSVPCFPPVAREQEEQYIKDIDAYLDGKSLFLFRSDLAYFGVPVNIFPLVDLEKSMEQLLYVMKRFSLRPGTFADYLEIIDNVPSTNEILALTVFGEDIINHRWADWANLMLQAGYHSTTMQTLALQPAQSADREVLKEQMNTVMHEFNMTLRREDVLNNYLLHLLLEANSGNISASQAVQCLTELYLLSGLPELYNFVLLGEAKKQLDETGHQQAWTFFDLTPEGVDSYIINYLNELIDTKPQVSA